MNLSFSIDIIVKVVKRFFLLMIIAAIVLYAAGTYLAKRSTSVSYYSYTDLYIHTIASGVDDYTKFIDSEAKYVDTYLLTIDTYKFYEELRQQLPEEWKNKVSAGYLKSAVSPVKRAESAIIRFTVYTYNAELTSAITKTLSVYMDDYLFNNYRVNSVQVVEEPRPATASISQSRNLSLILAVLGVVIAFAFGYFKEIRDRSIKSVADAENFGVPVLGVIPDFSPKSHKRKSKNSYSGYEKYSKAAIDAEMQEKSSQGGNEKTAKKKN